MPNACRSKLEYATSVLTLLLLSAVSGCGSGAAQLEEMGNKIAKETDTLLGQFEAITDVNSAETALPELLASYDRLVANAESLESTARKNLGRGLTTELQEKLTKQREDFSNRFQAHRKKLSKNLKVMQILQPLFQKMAASPFD